MLTLDQWHADNLGIPDEDHVFLDGYCAALALVMNHATGWPITCPADQSHFMVISPEGWYVDVTGPNLPEVVTEFWAGGEFRTMSAAELWTLVDLGLYEPPGPLLSRALDVASRVLTGMGYAPCRALTADAFWQMRPLTVLHHSVLDAAARADHEDSEALYAPTVADLGSVAGMSEGDADETLRDVLAVLHLQGLLVWVAGADQAYITDEGLAVVRGLAPVSAAV